jgi:hypothetical protein
MASGVRRFKTFDDKKYAKEIVRCSYSINITLLGDRKTKLEITCFKRKNT